MAISETTLGTLTAQLVASNKELSAENLAALFVKTQPPGEACAHLLVVCKDFLSRYRTESETLIDNQRGTTNNHEQNVQIAGNTGIIATFMGPQ